MSFFTYSPSLASTWFSVRGSTALGVGCCWEMFGHVFSHHSDLGNGGGCKEVNILLNKIVSLHSSNASAESRNLGSELEILWERKLSFRKNIQFTKVFSFSTPEIQILQPGQGRTLTFPTLYMYTLLRAPGLLQGIPWSVSPLLKDKLYLFPLCPHSTDFEKTRHKMVLKEYAPALG